MTDRLHLPQRYRRILEGLLREHVPEAEVWAYGSRITGESHEGSDLDLVVRGPELKPLDDGFFELLEAIEQSNIPILVQAHDWARLPESFHAEIERDYVVVQGSKKANSKGDWREVRLGEVIELKRGYDLPRRKRLPGSIPLVSSSGVTDYHAEAKVNGPGVVTGRYGTLGQVFYLRDDFWPLNTTLYVRDFKGNYPRFIAYLLREIDFSAYSDKAAVPGVNRNHLHQATVRIPAVAEQRAIADALGTLDDKIELNRRVNETLEEMARALFKSWFIDFLPVRAKQAARTQTGDPVRARAALVNPPTEDTDWTADRARAYLDRIDKDIVDHFPDKLVASELGEIPEGWGVKALGDVVEVVGGTTPSTKVKEYWDGGTHCWATPKDLSDLSSPVLLDTDRKITDAGLAKIGSGLLPKGTLLLSSRAPIGYVAINEVPVAINQGFIGMPPGDIVSNLFLLNWCRAFHEVIINHANGSTFLEISKRDFRLIPIVMPDVSVIHAFVESVRPLYDHIVSNERESSFLAAQRDGLLPRLVSGEVSVS